MDRPYVAMSHWEGERKFLGTGGGGGGRKEKAISQLRIPRWEALGNVCGQLAPYVEVKNHTYAAVVQYHIFCP